MNFWNRYIKSIIQLDRFQIYSKKKYLFCFKYSCIEGCINCITPILSDEYLPPIFCFDNNYIHMLTITGLIYNQLKNTNSVFYKCGYYKEQFLIKI